MLNVLDTDQYLISVIYIYCMSQQQILKSSMNNCQINSCQLDLLTGSKFCLLHTIGSSNVSQQCSFSICCATRQDPAIACDTHILLFNAFFKMSRHNLYSSEILLLMRLLVMYNVVNNNIAMATNEN